MKILEKLPGGVWLGRGAEEVEREKGKGSVNQEERMPQDRESGAKASEWGHRMAELIARKIGASGMSKTSNECKFDEERIVIKCANAGTQSVGVTYHMLERLDRIVAAFRLDDGSFELWALRPAEFKSAMRESLTSAGKTGLVERSFFERHGKSMGRVAVEEA